MSCIYFRSRVIIVVEKELGFGERQLLQELVPAYLVTLNTSFILLVEGLHGVAPWLGFREGLQ